ncbi:MAG: UDP-N-acetylglucosamine 2-epimerase (non-hydrolyzing) [bacterium]|nr:UDP-N-acetylglucosamine 2-epimerase (non-hydrolyzing) [bacterium]
MKVLTVVGARPQFVKAAMVSKAILDHGGIEEIILHTGQHYDPNMSAIFFTQMGIPKPAIQLNCGGGTHGAMTGKMLAEIEAALLEHKPDRMMVYGDTDSTLAGALAAAKLHIPVAHVEAGLRSFNKAMPEEINRILTDHVSDLLLVPTQSAVKQLATEGITKGVHHIGDVMYDAAKIFGELADAQSTILERLHLTTSTYVLVTCHRAENTDAPHRLTAIWEALTALAANGTTVILPLHPRTEKVLKTLGRLANDFAFTGAAIEIAPHFILLPPISFLDMVALEKHATVILTDSGGVQKEAYFHGVRCVTLRDETEWVETVETGWNILVGADKAKILDATAQAMAQMQAGKQKDLPVISDYGTGTAAQDIVKLIVG